MELKIDAHLGCLGTYVGRYVPEGYFDPLGIDEQLEVMSKIDGLTGLFTFYPNLTLPSDPVKLIQKLKEFDMKVSNVAVQCWRERKYKNGSFSTNEKHIRKQTVELFKKAVDFARVVQADSVLLWPAHDGFDYAFQTNYFDSWKNLVDTIKEIGEYDRSVKIAVEYKAREPRQKNYVGNVGKLMMLLNDIGLDNVTGVLDVGHAFMIQENVAESVVIMDSHGKLGQVHLNDNYKDADPDMIVGTVNFWEMLEFFYYLNKTDFKGWCSIDAISPRNDRAKGLELGVKMTRLYKQMADSLTKYANEIEKNLDEYRFIDNIELINSVIFKT